MCCNLYDKEKVIEACNYTIASINNEREKLREIEIEREMKKRIFILFGRTFTRSEAVENLQNNEIKSVTWYLINTKFISSELKAREMLVVAKNCMEDVLHLSTNEITELYWPNND